MDQALLALNEKLDRLTNQVAYKPNAQNVSASRALS